MCESGGASAAELQAETIEVVPELPAFTNRGDDSGDEFSEYSDENDMAIGSNNMDGDDDDDEEPFDEYGKKYIITNWFIIASYIAYTIAVDACVCVSGCAQECECVSAWL